MILRRSGTDMFENKRIWMYWEQGWDDAPILVQECAASWERMNPGWEVVRLDRSRIAEFDIFDEHVGALADKSSVQLRSDLVRLFLLIKHGGVWADATLYCRKPLETWVELDATARTQMFINPGPDRLISSWFIAANPDSPILTGWANALVNHIATMPNLGPITGWRKVIRKLCDPFLNRSPQATLWWFAPLFRKLSVWPYFLIHYAYNRVYFADEAFRALALGNRGASADPCHLLNIATKRERLDEVAELIVDQTIPCHKLDWRQADRSPNWAQWFMELSAVTTGKPE